MKNTTLLCFLIVLLTLLTGCSNSSGHNDYILGLIDDEGGGSLAVRFDTDDWSAETLCELNDVSSDNYLALSSDGAYLAYTSWAEDISFRYLVIVSQDTKEEVLRIEDLERMTQIINIAFVPGTHTLVYTLEDQEDGCYQEIRSLDIDTGETSILVRGESWLLRTASDESNQYYLKGSETYLYAEPSSDEWLYFLTQDELDEIVISYGGNDKFLLSDVPNRMYVVFSPPRPSPDGTKIIFSATLTRNMVLGEFEQPFWMASSVWEYDFESGDSHILYSQNDGGCIGRVDWIDNDRLVYVAYYGINGEEDDICMYDMTSDVSSKIFIHNEDHYNNVTLIPLNNTEVIFTSSAKDELFDESTLLKLNVNDGIYTPIEVTYTDKQQLLERFTHVTINNDNKN